MAQSLFSSSRGPKSSHGVGPRGFRSCSKELSSKGEDESSIWGWLLVPRDHSQREPMTTDWGSHCPPHTCPVLLVDSRQYYGKPTGIPYCLSGLFNPLLGQSWCLPQLRLWDEVGVRSPSLQPGVGRRSDLISALGSTVCVCVCVCVRPSRGSLTPKPFERVWCNSCKPDCLGLNFQLHHLLAVWPWAIYLSVPDFHICKRGITTKPSSSELFQGSTKSRAWIAASAFQAALRETEREAGVSSSPERAATSRSATLVSFPSSPPPT